MKKNKMKIDKINLVFVLPAMLIVFLLLVYPIISSVYFSFTSKNLIRPYYKWIWFDNFKFVLTNPEFYHAFLTSIKWTVLSITGQLLVGFIAALSLNRIPKFSGFYRTLLIIPWAFPAIVIAFSWKWILNDVYGFIPNIWFGAPLFMVNILAALKTIPREQYEAAIVDGASSFQVFRYITIRHIRGVIGLLVVLRTIWVFNNFDLLYLLTGGGPSDLTTTLPIYAYKTGWNLKRLGTASAVTILLLLFLMAVCFGYFKLLNRWEREDDK